MLLLVTTVLSAIILSAAAANAERGKVQVDDQKAYFAATSGLKAAQHMFCASDTQNDKFADEPGLTLRAEDPTLRAEGPTPALAPVANTNYVGAYSPKLYEWVNSSANEVFTAYAAGQDPTTANVTAFDLTVSTAGKQVSGSASGASKTLASDYPKVKLTFTMGGDADQSGAIKDPVSGSFSIKVTAQAMDKNDRPVGQAVSAMVPATCTGISVDDGGKVTIQYPFTVTWKGSAK